MSDGTILQYTKEVGMETLKVSSKSEPKSVAGAIAAILRNGESVEIMAIGASAVNQAVKSIAVARSYVTADEIDLVSYPAFSQIEIEGKEKTSIKFVVEKR
jgi:stage V sporulation protein S